MGFFKDLLRKSQGLPTDSEIQQAMNGLRMQIKNLNILADGLDAINNSNDDIRLGPALRLDLLNFSLHIAASDGILDKSEVDAINLFLGSNFSFSECKRVIEELGLGSVAFTRELPISFQILTELSRVFDVNAREFAENMISTYIALGSVIASVDGNVSASEQQDLDRYINMLKRYADTF